MEYSKVLEEQERILKPLMKGKTKDDTDCSYLLKSGPKHCKATTNKSCKGCKFFSPTIHARMRLVVQAALEQEASRKKTEYENKELREERTVNYERIFELEKKNLYHLLMISTEDVSKKYCHTMNWKDIPHIVQDTHVFHY